MGERTEMYYMPQVSPLPAELTVERWAADRAVEQLRGRRRRGPTSALSPSSGRTRPLRRPCPSTGMYDPDRMPNPVRGDLETSTTWTSRSRG